MYGFPSIERVPKTRYRLDTAVSVLNLASFASIAKNRLSKPDSPDSPLTLQKSGESAGELTTKAKILDSPENSLDSPDSPLKERV